MASVHDCLACGRPNPEDAAFCSGCGARLSQQCAACGRENPIHAVFCMGCGSRLSAQAAEAARSHEESGERRHLTVMFCDLVDSTRLAGELDPEDMRDLVLAYHAQCSDVIASHSGYLAKFLGDGVLAYFGYPEAHEDDARLAVAAAVEIIESMARLRSRFKRTDIDARVGLHSGEVVVVGSGSEAGGDHDIVGETPNIAARLQSVATPGSVIISDRTEELVEGFFALESLGALELKGVTRRVPAYRVLAATGADSRFEAVAGRGLTPLVGRDAELGELLEHWEAAEGGEGRVVLLSGDPGIGKSRLAHELRERASAAGHATVRLRCSPYNTRSALFPFVECLLKVVGGADQDPPSRLDRLENHLAGLGLDAAAVAPSIAELLAIPTGDRYPVSTDSPDRRKRRRLAVLFAWLQAQAASSPMLLVVEDVQWIDPTTTELIGRYFEPDPVPGVLVLLTHRADFAPPWVHRAHVHRLTLERLGREAIRAIVEELTGGLALPDSLDAAIGARTDGIPLFVEEITHAVLESGYVEERSGRLVASATLPERLVPSTLRESLMARLDRLGEAREVAQMLSVVGREATFGLLRVVSELDDAELEAGLDRLVDTDLVRRRHSTLGTSYVLKHWLVQDVAYESLLRSARRRYHERIADSLPAVLPEIVETQPEFMAHHLIRAGQDSEAISFLQRAGELAHRRSSMTEAIEHLTRALSLLREQPESALRDERELTLLLALGAPMTAAKGYSAREVEEIYTRAGDLCQALGDDQKPQFFRALYGTWRVHLLRADYVRALEFAHQLQRLAEPDGTGVQIGAAHRALGSTMLYLGEDLAEARRHLEIVIASDAFERSRTSFIDELHDVVDPWITCHAYQAWALWLTGSPAHARQMSERAMALSVGLQHPFTRALTLSFDSWLCQWNGDVDGVAERAGDALAIAKEQGFQFWIGWDEIMLGWAQAARGEPDAGLELMHRGLTNWRAVGSELGTTFFLTLMAEAQKDAGRMEEAWRMLDEADEVIERTREGWWSPEVRRLRGELLWRRGTPIEEVEHQLRSALELANVRCERSLALRVNATLAEVLLEQGRVDEAGALEVAT
ncbi:MAG TPA: adenylate/guanylate cyclase domain-containing protein [Solirubrobacteraceae bacterium]|nr:adenylate/guanylate cyclase domain-containing protein [Solirubrobacteraceae bacterium]